MAFELVFPDFLCVTDGVDELMSNIRRVVRQCFDNYKSNAEQSVELLMSTMLLCSQRVNEMFIELQMDQKLVIDDDNNQEDALKEIEFRQRFLKNFFEYDRELWAVVLGDNLFLTEEAKYLMAAQNALDELKKLWRAKNGSVGVLKRIKEYESKRLKLISSPNLAYILYFIFLDSHSHLNVRDPRKCLSKIVNFKLIKSDPFKTFRHAFRQQFTAPQLEALCTLFNSGTIG